jgi:integrase
MTYMTNVHSFEHGKLLLYQRNDTSDGRWHYRISVTAEKRYVFRSTKSADFDEAKKIAHKAYWNADALKDLGETAKLFARPFGKVADEFEASIQKRVEAGLDKTSKLRRLQFALTALKEFIGATAINKITEENVDGYEVWRSTKRLGMKKVSIAYEVGVLKQLFKFAVKQKYMKLDNIPEFNFKLKRSDIGKKPGFTHAEYLKLCQVMIKWIKEAARNESRRTRKIFREYVRIIAGSGMRVGEIRNIKWEDVTFAPSTNREFVYIRVKGKTGERTLVAMDETQEYFNRIRKLSKFTADTDYVFVNEEGKPYSTRKDMFDGLLTEANLLLAPNGDKRCTTSLRHYYATQRLLDGKVDVMRLAENMGTSIQMIKQHYADVNPKLFRYELTHTKAMQGPGRPS